MKTDFDVIVAGGGMVGAGLAALFGSYRPTERLRIAVLEPKPVTMPAAGTPLDLRVSALSRASQALLERTGAWPHVLARGAAPYRRMVVWEERGTPRGEGSICFDAAELGEPDLGHIVENRAVQAALLARAVQHGVTILRAGLDVLEIRDDAVSVTTGEGRRLSTALLVGADGGESVVRRLAGIGTRGWEYGQHAIVAHLAPELPHAETAWQRFLSNGPIALLPLVDRHVSLVWSTSPEEARELARLDSAAFAERVTVASAGILGHLEPVTGRAEFPLRLMHALSYTRPRIALVGDAAHGVHPLAGQGVNLGLMDCAALVDVIGDTLAAGGDPGDVAPLRRYERWRKAENLPAMALMDGLKRLFSNDDPLLSWARRTGLSLADRAAPVKRRLIERAMGLAGEIPRPVARESIGA